MGNADIDKAEILLKLPDILKSDNLGNVHVILLKGIDSSQVPIVRLMDLTNVVINTKLLRDYSKIDVCFDVHYFKECVPRIRLYKVVPFLLSIYGCL
ncbi:unnamed protein product [Lactuca virosa]|uniref:Uncharacterized protein n=1 Tax=Lactuca virosa TaxID=75947 RepID=A0AAU9NZM7_9ASTR|nr:unnamed protein product [Lactuca virosa]